VIILDALDATDHLGVLWNSVRRVGGGGMDVEVACWDLVGATLGVPMLRSVVFSCVVAADVSLPSRNALACERFADFVGVSSGVGGSLCFRKTLAVVMDFFGVVRYAPLVGCWHGLSK